MDSSSSSRRRMMMMMNGAGADGGRVLHRDKRTSRLAVVVAVQHVLVTACLVVTLYVYIQSRRAEKASKENVHIQFSAISDISENVTLEFNDVQSSYHMGLAVGKDKIYVSCSGPYVLYMDLCYRDMSKEGASGILKLQVVGRDHPVSSFPLHASRDDCRRLHRIVYLKAKEEASLHWYSTDSNFKIKNVTVGLSYLLGSRCDS